ncbi:unnamed protein product, partial [marine sediment metagenome]
MVEKKVIQKKKHKFQSKYKIELCNIHVKAINTVIFTKPKKIPFDMNFNLYDDCEIS